MAVYCIDRGTLCLQRRHYIKWMTFVTSHPSSSCKQKTKKLLSDYGSKSIYSQAVRQSVSQSIKFLMSPAKDMSGPMLDLAMRQNRQYKISAWLLQDLPHKNHKIYKHTTWASACLISNSKEGLDMINGSRYVNKSLYPKKLVLQLSSYTGSYKCSLPHSLIVMPCSIGCVIIHWN